MRSLIICLSLLFSINVYAELTAHKPRVRAMPPGQVNTAAFLTLHNKGKQDIRLVSASTNAAKKAEFHQHKMSDKGVMSMSAVDHIDIKAGQSFEFKSGAHHIMVMGLNKMLKPGDTVTLTLVDNQQQEYQFNLPVMSIMAAQNLEKNQHQHH